MLFRYVVKHKEATKSPTVNVQVYIIALMHFVLNIFLFDIFTLALNRKTLHCYTPATQPYSPTLASLYILVTKIALPNYSDLISTNSCGDYSHFRQPCTDCSKIGNVVFEFVSVVYRILLKLFDHVVVHAVHLLISDHVYVMC